jgi:hypothetical protein
MRRREEVGEKALQDLQQHEVLMLNGHFDFGNGYHGRVYLNPHQLFRHPSTIWRFAQDLLDVLPASILEQTEVVAGPVTGGALLAHTMAGLLDSRRPIARPATLFAPFSPDADCGHTLSRFYQQQVSGRRVLLVDDVRNTGQTGALRRPGGTGRWYRRRDRTDLRPDGGDGRSRRTEHRPRRIQSAGELPGWRVSDVQGRPADHVVLVELSFHLRAARGVA